MSVFQQKSSQPDHLQILMKGSDSKVHACAVATDATGGDNGYVTSAKGANKTWSVHCDPVSAGIDSAIAPPLSETGTFTAQISGNDDFVIQVMENDQAAPALGGTYPVQVTNRKVQKTLRVRKQFVVATPVFKDEKDPPYNQNDRADYFTKKKTFAFIIPALWTSEDYFKDMWTIRPAELPVSKFVEATNEHGSIMNNYYDIKNFILTGKPPMPGDIRPSRPMDPRCKLYRTTEKSAVVLLVRDNQRYSDIMKPFVSTDRFDEHEFLLLQEEMHTPSETILKSDDAFIRLNDDNAYVVVCRDGDVRALAFFNIGDDINILNMYCSVGHGGKSACECVLREIENIAVAVERRRINVYADMAFVLRDCKSVPLACASKTGGPFTYSSLGFKWIGKPEFFADTMKVTMTKFAW